MVCYDLSLLLSGSSARPRCNKSRRGRPSNPKVEGPQRPQGRLKGPGKLQCLLQNANGGIEPKKRRPLKEKDSGAVAVDYHIVSRFFSY